LCQNPRPKSPASPRRCLFGRVIRSANEARRGNGAGSHPNRQARVQPLPDGNNPKSDLHSVFAAVLRTTGTVLVKCRALTTVLLAPFDSGVDCNTLTYARDAHHIACNNLRLSKNNCFESRSATHTFAAAGIFGQSFTLMTQPEIGYAVKQLQQFSIHALVYVFAMSGIINLYVVYFNVMKSTPSFGQL
jgi:hypothetical protein